MARLNRKKKAATKLAHTYVWRQWMSYRERFRMLGLLVLLVVMGRSNARAQQSDDNNGPVKKIFVIAMENHNWTQPANQFSGTPQQIFQNPNAAFINSLVNGTATATINGGQVNISKQVAYASNYYNVLATASGNNPHILSSEPNHVWAEAGTNFFIGNDLDPFVPNGSTIKLTVRIINGTWFACWPMQDGPGSRIRKTLI